ncbi:MAG: class I SAM-dependent methyltransferase [Verrucomicrobiales bacterium]|nr:class I SAM-dependent methyltransferase [Verrucomicrobiales bacterium]MCP5559926.1 class I SAM-dependent methyltransferase [Verrucomicrobiaceae bacterium]
MTQGQVAEIPGANPVQRYYALHSRIYDATRWSFLFGRDEILHRVKAIMTPERILEVGCGTGRNLAKLRRLFPKASLTGVDMSSHMIEVARCRPELREGGATLIERCYDQPVHGDEPAYDLVLFSYALSMFNPGWAAAIASASADLAEDGCIAVVDFCDSRFESFKRWMQVNHVRMEGHLWPVLKANFEPLVDDRFNAYGGVWNYGIFIGRNTAAAPH